MVETLTSKIRVMKTSDTVGEVLGPITLAIETGGAYVYMYITADQAMQHAAEVMAIADEVESAEVA